MFYYVLMFFIIQNTGIKVNSLDVFNLYICPSPGRNDDPFLFLFYFSILVYNRTIKQEEGLTMNDELLFTPEEISKNLK